MNKVEENKNEKPGHDKEVTLIVNTREKIWKSKVISYEEVSALAFEPNENGENILYAVTFYKGDESRKEGSLTKGASVKVKDGMIFNVTPTNKS